MGPKIWKKKHDPNGRTSNVPSQPVSVTSPRRLASKGGYDISLRWHGNGESWREVEEAVMKICRFSGKVLDAGKQLLQLCRLAEHFGTFGVITESIFKKIGKNQNVIMIFKTMENGHSSTIQYY